MNYGWDLGEDNWKDGMDENLLKLDAVVHLSVKARQNAVGTETDGFRYLVGDTGAGAWTGHDDEVAVYIDDGIVAEWQFYPVKLGWLIYVETGTLAGRILVAGAGTISVDRVLRPTNLANTIPVLVDSADPTKELRVDVSGVDNATARTWTVPNKNITPMNLVGDSMTGSLGLHATPGLVASTEATIDFSKGNVQEVTLDQAAWTPASVVSSPASGTGAVLTLIIKQDGAGARTVTFPAEILWAAGSPGPTITVAIGAIDVVRITSIDGGTTYYGEVVGQAFA